VCLLRSTIKLLSSSSSSSSSDDDDDEAVLWAGRQNSERDIYCEIQRERNSGERFAPI